MISNKYVDDYIKRWEWGELVFNQERVMLVEYLRREILPRDDIYFNDDLIEKYIRFSEKNFFPLAKYQKFITPFIFLYQKEDDEVFFDEFLITIARGGGKNGFMTSRDAFFISPLHGIRNYDVTITANSEKQAKVSFKEFYEMVQKRQLENQFYLTKEEITGTVTGSVFRFRTNNVKTMDSARDGCLEFDEIHQFENFDVIDVQSSGLGKIANPRVFYSGTNGYVREGAYDKLIERAIALMKGETDSENDRLFPFICRLDHPSEVDDMKLWSKANPMLEEDTPYARRIFTKTKKDYLKLEETPSGRKEFMTKRMNITDENLEESVASPEEIMATKRGIPDLTFKPAIGGLDFASIRDFAAVGLLFRDGDDYIWLSHSFARKEYLQRAKLKPPIKEWSEQGLLTIVDEPSINPQHIVDWFVEMREHYNIQKIVGDNFRMDLLRPLLEAEGFEVEVIRNPKAIHSLLAPRIEDAFANRKVIFGNNPLMRWYTGNVAVKVKKDGNKEFLKKDEHRRKTDGFQAWVHAMYRAEEIQDNVDFVLGEIKFW